MPLPVILAAAMVATAIPFLVWAVVHARPATRAAGRSLLALDNGAVDLRAAVLQRSAAARAGPLVGALAHVAHRLTPVGWIESLERRLTSAGLDAESKVGRVLIVKFALGAAAFGIGSRLFTDGRTLVWLLAWMAMTALGYLAPDLWLVSRGRERQKVIGQELPDTLDQMTISVEAGLGFDAAMTRVARTGLGPLAFELARTMKEMQVGVPRSEALRNLSNRVSSPDVQHFATAIVQAEAYGIPIADILRTQAGEQRIRRRQLAEEHAMKIPVKIIFPVVLCVLPTLFIVVIGPAIIQIARTLFGDGGM